MNRPRKNLLVLLLFFCPIFFAGCGGGGTGDSGDISAYPLTSRLRQLQSGDSYSYEGDVNSGNASTTVTIRQTYAAASLNSAPVLLLTAESAVAGQSITEKRYYRQDSTTGDISVFAGSDGAPIASPVISLPGTWQVGQKYTRVFTGNDGQQTTLTFEVTGIENAYTRLGYFRTYRTLISQDNSDYSTSGVYYWSPGLGNYARAQYSVRFKSGELAGQEYNYIIRLLSTTVPIDRI